uniref:Uncharacterized protein n=1 Tax=Oryza barthii TaxID=65489 RepID=A0A0D3HRD5_9ORYZ
MWLRRLLPFPLCPDGKTTRRRREAGFEVVSILLCVPAYDAVLMPLACRVTGVRRSPAVLMPPRSCSGSASAEPPAPTEEPCRRSTSRRHQEEERVGRASGGGAEEVRVCGGGLSCTCSFLSSGEISWRRRNVRCFSQLSSLCAYTSSDCFLEKEKFLVLLWPMTTTTPPAAARTSAQTGFLEGEFGISPSGCGARTRCVKERTPTAQATPVFLAARGLVKAWYRVAMFGDEGPSLVAIPSST